MNINAKLTISDADARALGKYLTGRKVSATRAMICELAAGALASAIASATAETPESTPTTTSPAGKATGPLLSASPHECDDVARLRASGRCESYIRGWVNAGRVIAASRSRA